jgi:hypothetical protein
MLSGVDGATLHVGSSGKPRRSMLRTGMLLVLLLMAVSLLAHDSKWQSFMRVPEDAPAGHALEPSPDASAMASATMSGTRLAPVPATTGPIRQASLTPVSAAVATPSPVSSLRSTATVGSHTRPPSATLPAVTSLQPAAPANILNVQASGSQSTQAAPNTSMGPTPAVFAAQPAALAASPQAVVPLAAHPRLILDPATLTTLAQRAAANTAQWQSLKATCDSYIGGTVEYPTGNAYPNLPNAGSGYQGENYLPALLAEGMCYQVLKSSSPTAAAPYGAKAVDILMKMSAPFSTGTGNQGWDPCTDSGYGIRFYGVGFGLGYDWVYELLTPAQRTQVYTTANAWITAWEQPNGCADFEYLHPQSNYFAGYFHAKAVIALATYDENPSAPAQWADWLNNQYGARVQPYYQQHLLGGGWPEGYGNYAPLGILNMSLPAREVKTATGQDLIHATAPYSFPLASADYAMHFTWPSRAYFDDRDTNHSTGDAVSPPGTTPVGMFQQIIGDLGYWNSSQVGVFHQYLNVVSAATNDFNPTDSWLLFLDTDPNAPTAALTTLPLSYFAAGMNAVAARSDWGTGATWMSFRAGPYVNNPAQGEEYFDQGSLALVRGGSPLLINTGGWVVHEPNGTADEANVYNDNYGGFDGSVYMANRQLYNVFYVRNMSGSTVVDRYGQAAYTTEDNNVRTQVSAYEEGTNYLYLLATHLEDMYRPFSAGAGVAAWSREVVYLRPNRFVVYDRTTEGSAGYDQFLAWHFPASPAKVAVATGQNRFDVSYNGQYMGAMITVLPANSSTTTIPLYPGSNPVKAWQVQVRPSGSSVSQSWLTVFDLSSAAANVATTVPVTVNQGGIIGVQLLAGDGNSVVVSSTGAEGVPLAGAIGYRVTAAAADHVITDLAASTGYTVAATTSGNVLDISVSVGGTAMSSAKGVLSFNVTAAGVVQPNPPPVNTSPISTLPISSLPVPGYPAPYHP